MCWKSHCPFVIFTAEVYVSFTGLYLIILILLKGNVFLILDVAVGQVGWQQNYPKQNKSLLMTWMKVNIHKAVLNYTTSLIIAEKVYC